MELLLDMQVIWKYVMNDLPKQWIFKPSYKGLLFCSDEQKQTGHP